MAQKLKLKLPDHHMHDRQNFQKISQDGSILGRNFPTSEFIFFLLNDYTETKANTAEQIQAIEIT